MRVWDISVEQLCNKHLVAQHHEIHCIYSIIVNDKKGFAHHPEVMRWRGHLAALNLEHDIAASEMIGRGLSHASPIDGVLGRVDTSPLPWQSVEDQMALLKSKGCKCKV